MPTAKAKNVWYYLEKYRTAEFEELKQRLYGQGEERVSSRPFFPYSPD